MLQDATGLELPDLNLVAHEIAADNHPQSEPGLHGSAPGARATTHMTLARLYLAAAEGHLDHDDPHNALQNLRQALHAGRNVSGFCDKIVNAMLDWLGPKPLAERRSALAAMTELLRGPLHADDVARMLAGELHYIQAFEAYALGHSKQTLIDGLKGVLKSNRARKDRGLLSIMARSLLRLHAPALHSPVAVPTAADAPADSTNTGAVSPALWATIAAHLGEPILHKRPLTSGFSGDDVFELFSASGVFILRVSSTASCMAHFNGLTLAEAQGTRVPHVVAAKPLLDDEPSWLLQTALPGEHFDTLDFGDGPLVEQVLRELAHELHKVHQVRLEGFGSLSRADGRAEFETQAGWANSWLIAIESWCRTRALPDACVPVVGHALAFLMEDMAAMPSLCHGDLSSRNILVDHGHLTGLIDWDDSTGGDPLWDLACVVVAVELSCSPGVARHYNAVFLDEYLSLRPKSPALRRAVDHELSDDQQFLRRLAAHRAVVAAWSVGSSAGMADAYIQQMNVRGVQILQEMSQETARKAPTR